MLCLNSFFGCNVFSPKINQNGRTLTLICEKRAPRKIGTKPIWLPSQINEFTFLLTYLHSLTYLTYAQIQGFTSADQNFAC